MLDHQLEAILVDQKRFTSYLNKLDPSALDKGLMDRTVTLDGLVRILTGSTPLCSACLLRAEVNGVSLLTAPDNARFSAILRQVFSETPIDPYGGQEPLLNPNQDERNKNKITHLRHCRYYITMNVGIVTKDTSLKDAVWSALRPRFTQNAMRVLEHVRSKLDGLLSSAPLPDEGIRAIHRVFCYVHELELEQLAPDPSLCRREIAVLFVEALLGKDVYSEACFQWVAQGSVSRVSRRDIREEELLDSLSEYFGSGVFALERKEIQESLLPDIKIGKANREQVFRFQPQSGVSSSPLEQILTMVPDHNLFLLCGEEASGMSGAGKTTSMRTLYYNTEEKAPVFVPLYAVYSANSLRTLCLAPGTLRLLPWLEKQKLSFGTLRDLAPRLILLDGLDEITDPGGLQSLCDDLYELANCSGLRIVISSKLPPEKLASWDWLKRISSVWNRCMRCYIQPLRAEQKTAYVRDLPLPLQSTLTTPFLLRVYKEVHTYLSNTTDQTHLRWLPGGAKGPKQLSEAAVFYRYLVVQICRWFDANRANDAQNEADAFFLMHALPAVAFQMEISTIYDPAYTPEVQPVDRARAEWLLNQSFPAFKRALPHYPAYQSDYETLLTSPELLTQEGFEQGQAVTVLHRERNPETLELNLRFVNRAVQENLAALHLANLLFSASHNGLSLREDWLDFYTCPAYFLPSALWEKAVSFSDTLFASARSAGEETTFASAQELLEDGFHHLPADPLSRYLLCSLAAGMCGAKKLPEKDSWQAAAAEAYESLRQVSHLFAAKYRIDHILSLCGQAQTLRVTDPAAAAEKARAAIAVHKCCKDLQNSDGYHALAKVYLEQVQHILNGAQPDRQVLAVPSEELEFSFRIHRALTDFAAGKGAPDGLDSVWEENRGLAAPLLQILDKAHLRLHAYGEKEFFGDDTLRFLLTASYVAKAHSVYAAISRGTSGAALNMLGCFLENDQEELENHPGLPFFQINAHLHLPFDAAQLTYTDRFCSAFLVLRRIYHIKRGPQPYSAKKLAQALLARRVRLDQQGHPMKGPGDEPALNRQEMMFLNEATQRACAEPRPSYAIPRIRYLNECISAGAKEDSAPVRQEAGMLFRREWDLCSCGETLYSGTGKAPDLNAVLLAAEYEEGYLESRDFSAWAVRLCTFFRQQLGLGNQSKPPVLYTTGTRMEKWDLREAWERLCRLSGPNFPIHPKDGANLRWCEIAEHLRHS